MSKTNVNYSNIFLINRLIDNQIKKLFLPQLFMGRLCKVDSTFQSVFWNKKKNLEIKIWYILLKNNLKMTTRSQRAVLSFAVIPLNSPSARSESHIGGGTNTELLFDRHQSGHNMPDHVFLNVVFFYKQ